MEQYSFVEHSESFYRKLVGNGALNVIKMIIPDDKKDEDFARKLLVEFRSWYKQYNGIKTRPYDGIPELLACLRQKDIPLAVLSNKPHENTLDCINQFFGNNCFKAIRGFQEGIPLKPDPSAALEIADMLNVDVSQIAMVGDSQADIQTAVNARMIPIAVLWGFRTAEDLAHLDCIKVRTVSELKSVLIK